LFAKPYSWVSSTWSYGCCGVGSGSVPSSGEDPEYPITDWVASGIPFSCCMNFSFTAGEADSMEEFTKRPARRAATKNARTAVVLFILVFVVRKDSSAV